MKNILLVVMMVLGLSCFAQAEEHTSLSFPLEAETLMEMSINAEAPVEAEATSRYCCMQRGNYCDMGYSDRFGQPCKCYTGNNAYSGHVCRN